MDQGGNWNILNAFTGNWQMLWEKSEGLGILTYLIIFLSNILDIQYSDVQWLRILWIYEH